MQVVYHVSLPMLILTKQENNVIQYFLHALIYCFVIYHVRILIINDDTQTVTFKIDNM